MAHYGAMMVRALRATGSCIEVACFVAADYPTGLLAHDDPVYRYPVPHSLGPRDWPRWLAAPWVAQRCLRDIRDWQADVVHFNSGHPWYIPLIAGLRHRIPLVYTMHDATIHSGEWRIYEEMKRKPLIRHASRIVLHSAKLRAQALAQHDLAPERTVVIPCGLLRLPVPTVAAEEQRPYDLLVPGRILAYKGYDVLLQALPALVAACPQVRLVIVGEGDFSPWQSLATPWGERVKVINRFLSEAELTRRMIVCGMVVLPYHEASQSGVALLAASMGKPIVASRVGAIPEVIEDGVTGRLVEPGNPDELAGAILRLLNHPQQGAAMGAAARTLAAQRYGPEVIGSLLHKLYEDVLARPHG